MTLLELLLHNQRIQYYQDSLPIEKQIELLKAYKKSVFTFHMEDGRKIVRGDDESDRKEMEDFFRQYPQIGCKWVEFHK